MKDFSEFEALIESDSFKAKRDELHDQMSARYDELSKTDDEIAKFPKDLLVGSWVDRRLPMLVLREYHEWVSE